MKTIDYQKNRDAITYTLSEHRVSNTVCCYYITASLCNDLAVACVRGTLMHVKEIYQKIVQGTVTPCTLQDVLQDMGMLDPSVTVLEKDTISISTCDSNSTEPSVDKSDVVLRF